MEMPEVYEAVLFEKARMELTKESDRALVTVAVTFNCDRISFRPAHPFRVAVWTFYLIPLGLTRWSFFKYLTVSIAGVCTALIILAHLYNPGTTHDIAIINRVLGIVMVWVSAFF